MYGNNQFDGNAAFSGGGFMPSQATQTADTSYSAAKNRDTQGLLPLTVKQINDAFQSSDDKANFLIDGVDVNNVKLLGILVEKTEAVNYVSFLLDDGTGRMNCIRWVNDAIDTKELELLSNGMYVKVHGHMKGFQVKNQLVVYSVRRVTDYNEIANHFAECMYVHCYNTKARKMQDAAPKVTGHMPNSSMNTPSMGYQPTPSNQVKISHELKGIDQLLFNFLMQPEFLAGEKGAHISEIVQHLKVPEHKVLEVIETLGAEGLIYSTVDDFHYRSATNG